MQNLRLPTPHWCHPPLAIKPPYGIAAFLNLHLQGALEWLQQTSLATSAPTSQHSMLRRKPTSTALGVPSSTRAEDPLGLEGTDSAIPDLMATSSQTSPGEVTPDHIPITIQISYSPSLPAMLKTLDAASISPSPQFEPPRADPMRCFNCKGR